MNKKRKRTKATITLVEKPDGEIGCTVELDPPVTLDGEGNEKPHPAGSFAMRMLDAAMREHEHEVIDD